ncbi:TRAP transporter small permease [Psychromarinibacter sp. C21-152]|uniref:TRAP transporter small permease protein n=1 Tax=Psychromarinibacter sediminicola TaxID=3033385 RepID=A0AAE3T8T8_9RHOB|nr:TRAP transporter small permease [Psychromarinibacter sediminicola]MDF0601597.1 TRAP transporter small permease [Psychromarinibacter sediminicola]
MTGESVWLGPLRRPVQILMFLFVAAAVLLFAWLAVNRVLDADAIGMSEMLRPEGRPLAVAMLGLLFGALLFTALFLSDTIGAIEPRPDGFFDLVSLVLSRLAMVGIVLVVMVMFYEVVSRYVFEKPTLWANELSLWIAAFLFLLAGLYAMQQRSHIRIYIIYDVMPRWAQKLSDCVSVLLIWAFTVSLVWGGYNEAYAKLFRWETFGTAWDPPIPATVKPGILIIIGLVAIQALSNLIADWNKAPEHHSPADEIDETEIETIKATLKGSDNG